MEAIGHLETASQALLSDQRVRAVWHERDLWTWLIRLLAAIHEGRLTQEELPEQLLRLTRPRPTVVVAPIANLVWTGPALRVGEIVIARMKPSMSKSIAKQLGAEHAELSIREQLAKLQNRLGQGCVVVLQTKLQGDRAHDAIERALDNLIGLVLLLSPAAGPPSLRGPTNRPGLRGISLDRKALELLAAEARSGELGHEELFIDGFGARTHYYWHSAEPFDLRSALDLKTRRSLQPILNSDDEVARRLIVAARWYAAAHWSTGHEDAVLALGVALDALVGSKSGLPGIAMRQRFALLDDNAASRPERSKRFEELYSVRSTIAHGGTSNKIESIGGARGFMDEVRWAASQLLLLSQIAPDRAKDLEKFFADLSLGVQVWPRRSVQYRVVDTD